MGLHEWACRPIGSFAVELLTPDLRTDLLARGAAALDDSHFDPHPLVKYFTPDAGATWLISWAESDGDDLILWGLCDLGLGYPEIGPVRLSELLTVRGHLRLPVERDLCFVGSRPLSAYARDATRLGAIRA